MDERKAIARLKRGDIGGLEYLVRAHQDRATGAAYLIVHDWSAAEDIVQSAFLRVYERISQFDDTRTFAPWFLRIVTNDALKVAQRSRRHTSIELRVASMDDDPKSVLDRLADTAPGPAECLEQAESRETVWAAMDVLSPMQRQAVVLRYYLELTETQVATQLGVAPGTAKWHLHNARKRLATVLDGFFPGGKPLGITPFPRPRGQRIAARGSRLTMRKPIPRTPLGRRLAEQVEYARPRRMDLWPAIAEQIEAQHGRRVEPAHPWVREGFRLAGAVVAVVVFALILARMFEPGNSEKGSQPTPSVVATSTATVTIPVGGHPEGVAFAAGSMWVANQDDGTLSRIDPATNRVIATILIKDTIALATTRYYPTLQLAVSDNAIWVVPSWESGSKIAYSLVRIDPVTNDIAQTLTFIRSIQGVAVDPSGDSLWISSVDTDLLRLDTETGAEIARIDIAGSSNLLVTDGAVWVLGRSGSSSTTNVNSWLRRIDPTTNTLVNGANVELEEGRDIAFAAGSVWVTDRAAGKVHRIDPATNQIIASFDVAGANGIAADQSGVWITSETAQTVTRVDPVTNQIAWVYTDLPSASIGVGAGSAWVTNASANTVTRLNPFSSPQTPDAGTPTVTTPASTSDPP